MQNKIIMKHKNQFKSLTHVFVPADSIITHGGAGRTLVLTVLTVLAFFASFRAEVVHIPAAVPTPGLITTFVEIHTVWLWSRLWSRTTIIISFIVSCFVITSVVRGTSRGKFRVTAVVPQVTVVVVPGKLNVSLVSPP